MKSYNCKDFMKDLAYIDAKQKLRCEEEFELLDDDEEGLVEFERFIDKYF